MPDIRKACLLVFDYNEGKLSARELIELVSTIFDVCADGAADILCGLHAYKGTREDLFSDHKTTRPQDHKE